MRFLTFHNLGIPWLIHSGALMLHVFDEAIHDFLEYYNPIVKNIRQNIPWLPIPSFAYDIWLIGLIGGIVILISLSPLAFRNKNWILNFAKILAVLMIINGLLHLFGSFYLGRIFPGTYSSPVLILAAGLLLWYAIKFTRHKAG